LRKTTTAKVTSVKIRMSMDGFEATAGKPAV